MDEEGKAIRPPDDARPISIRAPDRVQTSEAPPVLPPDGWKFGRYELLGRLAYGGMAEIYLAREVAYGLAVRYVVVKRVLPHISKDADFIELFMDEARVAMRLTHPHISHMYEFGRTDGSYFLAMEWVNGVSLTQIAKRMRARNETLPVPVAARIVSQIAGALDYAHSVKDEKGEPLGIVHRDVTPHNIMVSFDGAVKLLDFGIAMAATRNSATKTGLVRGKMAYMSPQQCMAKLIDGRSDIFSLGVVLYELLTGKRLYKRKTDFEICEALLKDPVPSAREVKPELPEELDEILARALAKEPSDRYETSGQFQSALEGFLNHQQEIITAHNLAEITQELFALQFKEGPQLDTQTDLLNALSRVTISGDTDPPSADSSAPPTATVKIRMRGEGDGDDADEESSDAAGSGASSSHTRTVISPAGNTFTSYAMLLLLLIAVGLGATAVWFVVMGPGSIAGAPGATAAAPALATNATPTPSAPLPGAPAAAAADGLPGAAGAAGASAAPGAPAAPAADAHRGQIWINSTPTGAAISLNGNDTGKTTPAQLNGMWPGAYRITLRHPAYHEYRTRAVVTKSQVTQITGTMLTRAEMRAQREERKSGAGDGELDNGADSEPEAPENVADPTPILEGLDGTDGIGGIGGIGGSDDAPAPAPVEPGATDPAPADNP